MCSSHFLGEGGVLMLQLGDDVLHDVGLLVLAELRSRVKPFHEHSQSDCALGYAAGSLFVFAEVSAARMMLLKVVGETGEHVVVSSSLRISGVP
jgi:hypothetical protein